MGAVKKTEKTCHYAMVMSIYGMKFSTRLREAYNTLKSLRGAEHEVRAQNATPEEDLERIQRRRMLRIVKSGVAATMVAPYLVTSLLNATEKAATRLSEKFADSAFPVDSDLKPVPQEHKPTPTGMSLREIAGKAFDVSVMVAYVAYAIRKGYLAHQDGKKIELILEEVEHRKWAGVRKPQAPSTPPARDDGPT